MPENVELTVKPIIIRRGLVTTGCQQTFRSSDNRLSLDQKSGDNRLSLDLKVCWQPAIFTNKIMENFS